MLNATQDVSYQSVEEAEKLFYVKIDNHQLSDIITYHGVVNGKKEQPIIKGKCVCSSKLL